MTEVATKDIFVRVLRSRVYAGETDSWPDSSTNY